MQAGVNAKPEIKSEEHGKKIDPLVRNARLELHIHQTLIFSFTLDFCLTVFT